MTDLRSLLTQLNIPVVRNEFKVAPVPPYMIYISNGAENTAADNIVWHSQETYRIELYTTKKEGALERNIEALFDSNEIYWEKDGDIKVESESLWMTVYYI